MCNEPVLALSSLPAMCKAQEGSPLCVPRCVIVIVVLLPVCYFNGMKHGDINLRVRVNDTVITTVLIGLIFKKCCFSIMVKNVVSVMTQHSDISLR